MSDPSLAVQLLRQSSLQLLQMPSLPAPRMPSFLLNMRPFGEPNIPTASLKEITFTYERPLTNYNGHKEDLCTPCLEPEPTIHFCSEHAFHLPCLTNQIYGCSQDLIKKTEMLRINHILERKESSYFTSKTYSHSTYTLKIPEENLPKCPNCRSTEGGYLEATVVDRSQGPLQTKVEIENSHKPLPLRIARLKTFDHLTTILTIFETFLSYVQNSTPAIAGRVFVIQRLFLIANIVIVARNSLLLHSFITQRLVNLDEWYKKHAHKITLAGIAALGLATGAAVYLFNLYFRSAIDPQEFFKNIPISDLGSISCKWAAIPLRQQISQFVLISRIVSELALAYFSKERFRHLSHTILQIFTLFNVSQLQWLDFERTIPNALKTIPFTIQDSSSKSDIEFYQKIVEKIQTNFTILIPGNTSFSDVRAIGNSVYEYSSNVFKNSIWNGTTKGYYVYKVKYDIQLASSHLEPYIEIISALITTNLGGQGVFKTIPHLIFR